MDACVFAILSNHYHLLVRNRPDWASQWSDEEVVRRWWQLYPERRDAAGAPAPITELEICSLVSDATRVAESRRRLSSISWFMKSMNEWLAVRANGEDDANDWLCPLDENDCAVVLGPPQADSVVESRACDLGNVNEADVRKRWRHGFLSMNLDQYLELLDWTGRQIVAGKKGAIDGTLPPILQRLQLDPHGWLKLVDNFEGWFRTAAGTAAHFVRPSASGYAVSP